MTSNNCAVKILGLCLLLTAMVQAQTNIDPFRPGAERNARQSRPDEISSVEFVNTEITAIFKMISDLTGWSIIMSPGLSKQPPKINIWVKNMTPDQVLDQVASLAGLVLEKDRNTVHVMTFDEYAKQYGLEKRVLSLKHGQATEIAASIQPFIDETTGRVVASGSSNQIVLLTPKPMMDSLVQLIDQLDVPFADDEVRLLRLHHLEAQTVIPVLDEFLKQTTQEGERNLFRNTDDKAVPNEKVEGAPRAGQGWLVRFMVVPKLNAVVLRGLRADVENAVKLIRELDTPAEIVTIGYQLRYTNADEVFKTLEDLVEEDTRARGESRIPPRLRIAASEPNNRIIVEGSAEDHARLSRIIEAIDQPLPPGSGGTRVYRLVNASAVEVAAVIQELINQRNGRDELARQDKRGGDPSYIRRAGRNPMVEPVPAQAPSSSSSLKPGGNVDAEPTTAGDVLPAVVTAAEAINAVIVRGTAAEQEEFAAVIAELDQPRDQVLLEVTLVSVVSTNTFDLGVELSGARIGDVTTESVGFSSFGIGRFNSDTGTIDLASPSPFGLNFAMFNAGDFSLVLNALRTVGDTRITSAPKILAMDNSEAVISQINQEPFEVVSQGESSTVTSFGGFVDAGTTLRVIPHIADTDWLRLDYQVTLSSFGTRTAEQLAANLPPPRRESLSSGTVRVPAEHIIVLGGLASSRDDNNVDEVPLLADIPLLGELFKNRSRNRNNETLYIFIRPVVLGDPAFRDLLFLSEADTAAAKLDQEGPTNHLKMFVPEEAGEVR